MKKRWIFLMVFLGVFLLISFIIYASRGLDNYLHWRKNPQNVELYEEDYMRIVNLAFKQLKESGEDKLSLKVDHDLSGSSEEMKEATLSNGIKLTLTDEERESLKIICNNSFNVNNRSLAMIDVENNQVGFWPESFSYALIYTKDGGEPKVNLEYVEEFRMKKVKDHWYQLSLYEDWVMWKY